MNKRIVVSVLLICLILHLGCETSRVRNKMLGTWVVEEFVYNKRELLFDELKVNMVSFEDNGKCILPMREIADKDASWAIIKKDNRFCLTISNAKDTIYNKEFDIEFSSEKRGLGTADIVILKKDNLYWKIVR